MVKELEPAASIIRKFGGPAEIARVLGVHRAQPGRWMKSSEAGGCDGFIPRRHHRPLLNAARDKGIDLCADDFVRAREAFADA